MTNVLREVKKGKGTVKEVVIICGSVTSGREYSNKEKTI